MGNDHEGRAQHLSHAGHEDHRVDRACEDARLSAISQDETFAAVLQAFMSRHTLLKGAMTSLVLAYASPLTRYSTAAESKGFVPLTHSTEDKLLIRTFFLAIQHPGEGKGATLANPLSRFPDYQPDMPPCPSVVAIYRADGGEVGS